MLAGMGQAKGKAATTVQKVTFSSTTLRFLEALSGRGTHGSSVNDVIRTLVEAGIRQAIADTIIAVSDGQPKEAAETGD